MRVGARVSAIVLAVLAAGCGSDEREPEAYLLAPTRACLRADGARVSAGGLDFVASTALGGGLRVRLDDNFLTIAFGEDTEEAARIETAYKRFAGRSIPIEDVLVREKNVVMVWNAPPGPEDANRVRDCLRAAD